MQHLMNLVRFPVTGFTLRPMVDGVGVVARELLHFIKNCLDMERTATYYQDSEQSWFIDFSFLSPYWMFDMDGDNDTNSDSTVPEDLKDEIEAHTNLKSQYNEMKKMHDDLLEDWETAKNFLKSVMVNTEEKKNIFSQEKESLKTSLAELEKEYRALLNINEELAIENSDLNTEVWTLQDLLHVREVELFETRRRLDELTTEHEDGDVSLAEAERKYKEAMDSIAQLENEKSDLLSQVDTLRDSVQGLYEKCMKYDEIRDSPTEAERRYEKAMETNTQLERKDKYLTSKVNALQDLNEIEAHTNLKSQYNEMKKMHDDLLEDWETAKNFLKSVMVNTEEKKNIFNQETESLKTSLAELEKEYRSLLNINEELAIENSDLNTEVWTLQDLLHEREVELFETRRSLDELTTEHEDGDVSLAEAERKYKEAMDSIAQLENEKSDLMSQVDTLRDSVQGLYEKCMKYDEIRDSPTEAERRYEKAMETNTQLEKKSKYLTSKVNALQEDLSLTRIKWKDALREHEEGDVSLAEAERKYKEAMDSIAQLENEKSDLMSQVDTLRGSVQGLSEKCTKYDERRVFLVDILTKYKDAMMCNDKLENEKSALKYHAHIQQGSVQEMEEMLSDAEKKCDAIKQERDQEQEAHSILTSLYNLMTLTHNKKLLMDSQAEAQTNSEDKRDSTATPEDEQQQGCFTEE